LPFSEALRGFSIGKKRTIKRSGVFFASIDRLQRANQPVQSMKIFPRPRIFYVSPWLPAAATGLLVLIVVIFTLNNYQREKELMTEALLQKGPSGKSVGNRHAPRRVWRHLSKVGLRSEETANIS